VTFPRLSDPSAERRGGRVGPTPGEGPAAPVLREVSSPLLSEAAARVVAAWSNELGDAIDTAEVEANLGWLMEAVSAASRGQPLPDGMPGQAVLNRHLLDRLRAEVVAAWTTERDPRTRTVLEVLQGFETVGRTLEPDWSQYFSSRLAGPDGLDLVVEVAHDLRSPITSILFLAETLGRGQSGEVSDLQRRQLRLIYSAALGLSSMASDVIELARGGDQLVEREMAPLSLGEMIEAVIDMVRPIAEEKGLTLRFEAPPTDHRLGRPLALSRVLLNLTTNALKFTDEGFVEIATRAKGLSKVEFAVRDTGHGISDEALANLYQPFRRTRGRAGRSGYYFSGTGLGLAMCRKLVEAMGSELRFETRAGWGTRFFFELDLPPASHLGV
jgi:signal transduction histidine kinase